MADILKGRLVDLTLSNAMWVKSDITNHREETDMEKNTKEE